MATVTRIKLLLLLTFLLAGTALSARKTNPKKVPKNAVLLSKVSAITVRAGKQTTSRRVSPVPQLQCVGNPRICKLYSVDVMRCTNEGSDYDENNVQWSCKASLPEEFKLGSTEVTCEGYESSEDPYVLSGSCGVEYALLLTEKGEEKYGSGSFFDFRGAQRSENTTEKYAGYLFMGLFGVVLFIILRGLYNAWRRDTPRRRPRGGGGFGGGGGDNDPPPPYDPRPPPRPKKATWSSGSSSSAGTTGPGYQEQGWRPGFWTGTAAGAAAGYLAGRGARTQPAPQAPATGGWFGGGGGGGFGASTRPGPSSRNASSPSTSYSSTRHESTGFGGTSRR
ncbi:hypothetical protein AYO21_06255 [Fonsecaea monophora]|uniref:Store-operated calcium entry-associated regulatory factor n=1 Tax=Fonsecaea monophora TaxID=254056 RepID=A0A177F7P6_9EURO|nr:hypothetical protein AYO21_06255 [Fonsecaea monophora]KAH0844218.1 Store-operated calcium entry-associated regulatory factor [Fonsecaea pedrosoi]OAG39610.1 hypothetical protein AYO21_06255 [Fonsecaea monophora]